MICQHNRFLWISIVLLLCTGLPLHAEESEPASDLSMEHRLELNYQGVKTEGNAGSASEYRFHDPWLGFDLDFKGHAGKKHIYLNAEYLNDRDYLAEGKIDLNGRLKFNLSSERLWHNLEHIPYDPLAPGARTSPTQAQAIAALPEPRVTFEDQNPDAEYGLRVEVDEAEVIAKFGNYPAHVRLKYWRMQKEGEKQLRFSEEGRDDAAVAGTTCNFCHLQSKTRPVDRLTEEFSGSADAHVGYFDIVVEQLLRTFRVKDPIPVDSFIGHTYGPSTATDFQHDEDPESQLLQTTLTLRTALTGGFVVDGAYTYGKRENNSDLANRPLGVSGVSAESTYQKVSGNLSYTPLAALSFNMRYRMLDYDAENSDTVAAEYYRTSVLTPTFPVRDSMDVNRYEYMAAAAWRPSQLLTVKGEFQRETVERGNTGPYNRFSGSSSPIEVPDPATAAPNDGGIDPYWELPDKENIDQYRLSLTLRPLKTSALRINTWYRYVTDDEPAYGTSFDDKHEAFLGVNYRNTANWGVTATARALQEKNKDHAETVWVGATTPELPYAFDELSDREREQANFDLGFWVTPTKRITTGFNYGYVHALITQDLLFGASDTNTTSGNTTFDNVQDEVDYLQISQNYSLFMNIKWLDRLSTHFEGYYTRSLAKFKPSFSTQLGTTTIYPATSDGLTDISRLDVVQQGLNAGINWSPAERWSLGLTYGIDDYDARNSDIYDGTVQTCMLLLTRTW